MAAKAYPFGRSADFMILSGGEIDVVVARSARGNTRKFFPMIMRGIVAVASFTIAQLFIGSVTKHCLRIANSGKVRDPVILSDYKEGFTFPHARQKFAPMDFVDNHFEIEVLSGFGICKLRRVTNCAVAGLASPTGVIS